MIGAFTEPVRGCAVGDSVAVRADGRQPHLLHGLALNDLPMPSRAGLRGAFNRAFFWTDRAPRFPTTCGCCRFSASVARAARLAERSDRQRPGAHRHHRALVLSHFLQRSLFTHRSGRVRPHAESHGCDAPSVPTHVPFIMSAQVQAGVLELDGVFADFVPQQAPRGTVVFEWNGE